FLAWREQEVGQERDAIILGVEPGDPLGFGFVEHIPWPQDRRWLAVNLVDDRACHDVAKHRTVVQVGPGGLQRQHLDLSYLDPAGGLHRWQADVAHDGTNDRLLSGGFGGRSHALTLAIGSLRAGPRDAGEGG